METLFRLVLLLVFIRVSLLKTSEKESINHLNSYEVTTPYLYQDEEMTNEISQSSRSSLIGAENQEYLFVSIELQGKPYKLKLHLNTGLLSKNFSTSIIEESGNVSIDHQSLKDLNFCYYQGEVEDISASKVFLSTCDGMKGTIILPNETFFVEPFNRSDNIRSALNSEHIIYRIKDMKSVPSGSCGLNSENEENFDLLKLLGKTWSGKSEMEEKYSVESRESSETLFVQLLVVADRLETQEYGEELISRILEIVNIMDGYFTEFNIRTILVHIEMWSSGDQITSSTNSNSVLRAFRSYRESQRIVASPDSPWSYIDHAVLLTGRDLAGTTIGIAFIRGMCNTFSVSVTQDYTFPSLFPATVMTHELGHNFGMLHDDLNQCSCRINSHCIMQAAISNSNQFSWSDCSRNYLISNFQFGTRSCLFDLPDSSDVVGDPVCGNHIIEEGEECDCGLPGVCSSSCCNPTTCRLLDGAVCDKGLCCENCQLLPAGTQCRGTDGNECEIAEYCSGANEDCPEDFYVEDGTPCLANTATCFEGICSTRDAQCKYIHGEDTVSCGAIYYSVVNTEGNNIGNCGTDNQGNYIACSQENYLCGKLLCSVGVNSPNKGDEFTRISFTDGMVCVVETTQRNSDIPDPFLVRPGTSCGSGRVCNYGDCDGLPLTPCTDGCNGNGICSNKIECHCEPGWAPPNCNTPGYGGSLQNGPINIDGVTVSLESTQYSVSEGLTVSICTVLSASNGPIVSQFSFTIYTRPVSAIPDQDYRSIDESSNVKLLFQSGANTGEKACVDIETFDDELEEESKVFTVSMKNYFNGNPGDHTVSTVTILDDESGDQTVFTVTVIDDQPGSSGSSIRQALLLVAVLHLFVIIFFQRNS